MTFHHSTLVRFFRFLSFAFSLVYSFAVIAQLQLDEQNSNVLSNFSPNATSGGEFAWGDYDNDGDPDLIISSVDRNFLELYRNDNGAFALAGGGSVFGTNGGNLDWADYDDDGDLDLLVSRARSFSNDFLLSFHEYEDGVFTSRTDVGLPSKLSHFAAWGDYDDDGDPDIAIIIKNDLNQIRGEIYNNDDGVFTNIGASLPLASEGALDWGDYDDDGDLDLLITGSNVISTAHIYRNDEGTFVDIGAGLSGVCRGSANWGDFDADGDLDIVLTGTIRVDLTPSGATPKVYIYKNNGDHTFTDIEANLLPVMYGSSAWGDYDNDGDLDLVISGFTDWFQQEVDTKLYINNDGEFVDSGFALPAAEYGSAYWLDVDNDTDQDLFFTGGYFPSGQEYTRFLYKNLALANVWNGEAWSAGVSPVGEDVRIEGDYSLGLNSSLVVGSLYVQADATLMVEEGSSLTVNNMLSNDGELIVESGASLLTHSGQSVSDNIVIRRNTRYSDGRYSFVGSPVEKNANTSVAGLGRHIYTYNEAASAEEESLDRWIATNNTDQLIPGRGYTQANQRIIEFGGRPNAGTITYSGSYVNDGWHLVSNPYACAIDIDRFLDGNTNTTGAVYIWDDHGSNEERGSNSNYIVANKAGATDNDGADNSEAWNGHIGSTQGFFVKLDGIAGDIVFEESMRVVGENQDDHFFRKQSGELPLVRINLSSSQRLISQTIIAWKEDVPSNHLVNGYDAPVFDPSADFILYTLKSQRKLTIHTTNDMVQSIPLGYNVGDLDTYSLTIDSDSKGLTYYLIDHALNRSVEISTDQPYTFTSLAGSFPNRFELVLGSRVLSVKSPVNIYTYQKRIFARQASETIGCQLLSLSGQILRKFDITREGSVDLSDVPNGVYLVVHSKGTQKIILK
ncbi:MAG: T9SS type A sorting domain-containing protein [Marinoscillum sp.]